MNPDIYDRETRIFVAGDRSPVAKELIRSLTVSGYKNILSCNHSTLDLRNQAMVDAFFMKEVPQIVFLVAGVRPQSEIDNYALLRDNLLIVCNVVDASLRYGAQRVIYFSSDSALPWYEDDQIVNEDCIFLGPVKKRIEAYALSKQIGIQVIKYANLRKHIFTALLPCHIYGSGCTGFVETIVRDFQYAFSNNKDLVILWGTGDEKYNLIHVSDVVAATRFLLERELSDDCFVVAPKKRVSRRELAFMIARLLGYEGRIEFDSTKEFESGVNSSAQRLLQLGWQPEVALEDGLRQTIEGLLAQEERA